MAWIESHQELRNHPKTKKAARLLHIPEAQLIGHLHFLWWWAIDHAPDGDLTDYDIEEIEAAAGWDTDGGTLVEVLCTCGKAGAPGFLERTEDGRLLIHDWWEYAGKLITKRQQNADRVKEYRARNAHVTRTERACTPLNSTVQNSNRTVQKEVELPAPETVTDDDEIKQALRKFSNDIHLITNPRQATEINAYLDELHGRGVLDWWATAIQIACDNNARTWAYIRAILKNSLKTGHAPGTDKPGQAKRNGSGWTPEELRTGYVVPAEFAGLVQS